MSSEREAVKQKVIKLLNMTVDHGASEQEALVAAEKAGDLMAFYGIEMTELQLKNSKSIEVRTEVRKYGTYSIADTIAVKIAILCDCLVWRTYGDNGQEMHGFFGLPQDTEVALHLQQIIRNTMVFAMTEFKTSSIYNSSQRKKFTMLSFLRGMEQRLRDRIDELIEQKDTTIKESRTGNALVLLKVDQVKKEADELGHRYGVTKCKNYRYQPDAFMRGRQKGDSVSLNKGVSKNEGLSAIKGL